MMRSIILISIVLGSYKLTAQSKYLFVKIEHNADYTHIYEEFYIPIANDIIDVREIITNDTIFLDILNNTELRIYNFTDLILSTKRKISKEQEKRLINENKNYTYWTYSDEGIKFKFSIVVHDLLFDTIKGVDINSPIITIKNGKLNYEKRLINSIKILYSIE